jgi:REP element-mobilizing transposase RayT
MARLSRSRFWSSTAPANGLHHVTNRGVDRNPLFVTAVDRLIFLSLLAFYCHDDGLRVHCFCLMTNHFHLLVVDPRGLLSRMMLRLETAYARYLRDTRSRRGHGHVFGDRFFSRRIGSNRDYRAVVAYILRNPIACKEPLATSPEAYLWSTAAMLVSETTSATFCAELVEGFGGVDAILGRLPAPRTSRLKRARRGVVARCRRGAIRRARRAVWRSAP